MLGYKKTVASIFDVLSFSLGLLSLSGKQAAIVINVKPPGPG